VAVDEVAHQRAHVLVLGLVQGAAHATSRGAGLGY
jgi:hypothetical protein